MENNIELKSILTPERIVIVDSINKINLLDLLCEKLSDSKDVTNISDLKKSVIEREKIMSTGIGLGIGIPHVKIHSVKNVVMSAALSKNPVENYDSLDNQPIHIVFLIAAGFDQHHKYLQFLSNLSVFLKDEKIRQSLLKCETSEEFFKIIC